MGNIIEMLKNIWTNPPWLKYHFEIINKESIDYF